MSWIGKIFGADSTINKGLDLVDDAFHTDEEKAEQKIRLLKAYEPFKLNQRILTWMFGSTYCLAWLVTFGVKTYTGENVDEMLRDMGLIVGIIVAFYFGGGLRGGDK